LGLDNMYDTARLNDGGIDKPISEILSRADFWHLAANRAIVTSSHGAVSPTWVAGRFDPQQLFSDPTSFGPRFRGRLPETFAFSEMIRACSRNGMTDNFLATALLGGHTLGRAHASISGFRGSWDSTPTQFDNDYWKTLQQREWVVSNIEGHNVVTLETTNRTQYSLSGVNNDRSIQLFVDMDQLVATTFPDSICPTVKVDTPNRACAFRNPEVFGSAQTILHAWAVDQGTFFNAFTSAWAEVGKWGCKQNTNPPQCQRVDPTTSQLVCGSNAFSHTCSRNFNDDTPAWL
jgi:hypothetical protein